MNVRKPTKNRNAREPTRKKLKRKGGKNPQDRLQQKKLNLREPLEKVTVTVKCIIYSALW